MIIKLNYNTAVHYSTLFRVLTAIVNTPSITSIGALQSAGSGWTSGLITNLNAGTSYIVRTDDPVNVSAHIAKASTGTAVADVFEFMLKYKVYDNTTNYYISIANPTTTNTAPVLQIGSGVTNAWGSQPSWALTDPISATTAYGTYHTITGSTGSSPAAPAGATAGSYTLWAYITDTCFMFAISNGGASYSGFPVNSTSMSTLYGPFVVSQYERRDNWNTSTSPIIPVVMDTPTRGYSGIFGTNAYLDWTTVQNPASNLLYSTYSVFNSYVGTIPSANTSWATTSPVTVSWGIGSRYCDAVPMTVAPVATNSAGVQTYGNFLDVTTTNAKIPAADLSGKLGYPMYPLSFRRNHTNFMLGGNITSKGKFYLFNGDYNPGDEYTYNNKTYVLLALGPAGWTNRLAYAVPKE